MNARQESRFSMFKATFGVLDANADITYLLPNFSLYNSEAMTAMESIGIFRGKQEMNMTGTSVQKQQLRDDVHSQALNVLRRVVAYATFIKDPVLLNQVKYTDTTLSRLADTIFCDCCLIIHDRANDNLASLADYGIDAGLLLNLMNAIIAYSNSIATPRIKITDKKQATGQVTKWMQTVDDTLENIDTLVEIVKDSHPLFYESYHQARQVVVTGTGSLTVKGTVSDQQTGEGMFGVAVTFASDPANEQPIKGANKEGKLVKRTAKKGGFNVKTLPQGTYHVILSKPGYKDAVTVVNVTHGELSVVEVAMEKK